MNYWPDYHSRGCVWRRWNDFTPILAFVS